MADVADSLDATRGTSAAAINDGSQSSNGNDALCLGRPVHDAQGQGQGQVQGHDGHGHGRNHDGQVHDSQVHYGEGHGGHGQVHDGHGHGHGQVHDGHGHGHGDSDGNQNLNLIPLPTRPSLWYEEEIDENLRWCFGLIRSYTYRQTDIHTYIHTYIHTFIHTYIHTYIPYIPYI